jgi:hypothetical protein
VPSKANLPGFLTFFLANARDTGKDLGGNKLQEILQYLKDHGERLDSEIANETSMSLEYVCQHLSALAAKGEVIMCRTTRFKDDKKIEGMLCRAAGFIPPASPGRKPKSPK